MNTGGSGRFHVMSEPVAAPGKCGVCGTADTASRESFLDVGLSFDYYGVLYFCDQCVLDMSHQYGFVTPQEAESLKVQINDLGAELIRVKSRLAASEAYIASVFSVDVDSLTAADLPDPDSGDSVADEAVSDEGQDDSGSAKSPDEPRSDDVRKSNGSAAVNNLSL